jgi:xanthine dehydrogenase accessory factor
MSAPTGGLRGVCAALAAALAARRPVALAIVHATEGSTYRKPGALVAVDPDGTRHGALSGGCLEPELTRAAVAALDSGMPSALDFDTRDDDDAVFGSGSGCRGRMRVVLRPLLPARDAALLALLAGIAERDAPLPMAVVTEGPALGAIIARDGALAIGEAPAAIREILAGIAAGAPREVHVGCGAATHGVRVLHLRPAPRALLLGAGPEAAPLARLLREVGWRVEAADHRPALLEALRAHADVVHRGRPAAVLATLGAAAFDAAVVMTHGAEADLEALRALAAHRVGHVALLGPPARRDALLARLDAAARDALRARLQAPAGLPIGGEGPEMIALSIAAGLPHPR